MDMKINGKEIYVRGIDESEYEKKWLYYWLLTASLISAIFIFLLAYYIRTSGEMFGGLTWVFLVFPQLIYWWIVVGQRYARYTMSVEIERINKVYEK